MKNSLASATSVIALLALQPGHAFATTISLTPDPYNFGNVYFGAGAVTPTENILASVSNTAASTQTFSLTGVSTSGFSGTSLSAPIGPSSSATATVTYSFAPTVSGAASATATLSGNGVSSVLSLTGTGVAPVAGLTGGSAGNVLVGQSATVTVTATNTGHGNAATNVATSISNLNGTIGSSSSGLFATTGGGSVSINDGKSVITTYTFTPTLVGAVSASVTGTFTNGGSVGDGAASLIASLTGTGVAPVNSVTANSAYVRVGTSGTATVVITNTGNGNLSSAPTSVSNLNASLSASVGTGLTASGANATSISLNDGKTSTLSYTYTPISRGSASSAAVTASFSDGNSAGTNKAQTVTATVNATGVGPVYQSVYKGTTVTPTAVANGATATTGPTISLGTLGLKSALTSYLTLNNTTTDANGGQTTLTDLTIKGYSISGANASDFQVSLPSNSVLGEGGTLNVPITVTGNTSGIESASLTVFTDESVAYGGVGDSFTYMLTANVPEPAALATFGAGLAGLAFMRRRRTLART